MNIWIVEDGQLVEYERTGQCNQCGGCCCTHTISYSMCCALKTPSSRVTENDSDTDWAGSEGWSALYAQGVWWWFEVTEVADKPEPCPGYDIETKRCTRWQDMEDFRPICRYWPVNPKDTEKFPQCGFSFERIAEDLVAVKEQEG